MDRKMKSPKKKRILMKRARQKSQAKAFKILKRYQMYQKTKIKP